MKKFLLSALLISCTSLSAIETISKDSLAFTAVDENNLSIEERALYAIQSEDYDYIEAKLNSGTLSPVAKVDGKPLIIYAAILDKPEMILLLSSYGAMIMDPVCEEGKNLMEYAIENNAIYAQAQIIVIRA
ncbi:MAG: hypothetical protein P8I30_02395 [Flavobacteriaceae bacterium]|jgi:hypothetical protein|nr:hypothetical protein [Flavobacteriaceae bacterium]MDG1968255.1 hypothetical protein [Flavobacteriaceae bacterium]